VIYARRVGPALRIGLVGLGDAGRHHARALAGLADPNAAWVALAARDLGRVARFGAEHGAPEGALAFSSLEALLEARACDALVLATPDGLHAAQVEACAERGVHVLVEKPFALDAASAARAASLCRERGVVLQVGYHLRHHAGHRLVRERLDELAGPLRHVYVRWAWPDPAVDGWRARGDGARFWCLAALGTHGIDLARWFARAPLADVRALRHPPEGVDRAAEVSLRFENGVLAHISSSVTHRAVSRLSLAGERGEVEGVATLGARGGGALTLRAPGRDPSPIAFEPADPYLAQLRAFVGRVRAGDVGPSADDVANVATLDAIALDLPPARPTS
jgi:predicted dehydrogenase